MAIARTERPELSQAQGASEKTIKVHRARVMQKMAAGSLAELVRMAGRLQSRRRSDGPDASREAEARPKPP